MKTSNNFTFENYTDTTKSITLGDFMKTITIKKISLISVFAISWLIGIFNFLYTSKVEDFLNFMYDSLKEELYLFEYSKMYIAIYIFASIFIFLSLISFLMNVYSDEKINKLTQSIIFYINLACVVTIVVLLLVVYLKNYHILSVISANEEFSEEVFELLDIEFTLYGKLFIFLLLQGISNIILSILSFKNLHNEQLENERNEENSSNKKENSNPEKALILKEIEEMKAQLELQELKNEYMELYKKVNIDKEK